MVLCGISAIFPAVAAEPTPASKPELIFGYSTDGSPVSAYSNGVVGFCHDVYQYLEKDYTLKSQPQKVDERFSYFADNVLKGKPGIQCGPSSSTYDREQELKLRNGAFTQVFFTTSTRVLIKKEKVKALYDNTRTGAVKIGILGLSASKDLPDAKYAKPTKSTLPAKPTLPIVTSSSIKGIFPRAEFVPLNDKPDAVNQLIEGTIDGYASDSILLADMQKNNLSDEDHMRYSIEPPLGSSLAEAYVLVVYNEPTLAKELNMWLASSDEAQHAKEKLNSLVETDGFTRTLTAMLVWLNRSDHLELARGGLLTAALLLVTGMAFAVWWLRQKFVSSPQNALARFEQDERLRFASELHNQTNQLIIAAKRSVELGLIQLSKDNDAHKQTFASTLPILDEAVEEIRRISLELQNPSEDKLDALLKALKERTGIDVKNGSNILWKDLPDNIEKTLYPLIQEALHNIENYAKANAVEASLKKAGRQLQLEIRDNGRGFDAAKALKANTGNGLKLMRTNIEKLGGKCQIDSTPGRGTLIKATIPL
jgi:signal transduction histidine kinase